MGYRLDTESARSFLGNWSRCRKQPELFQRGGKRMFAAAEDRDAVRDEHAFDRQVEEWTQSPAQLFVRSLAQPAFRAEAQRVGSRTRLRTSAEEYVAHNECAVVW